MEDAEHARELGRTDDAIAKYERVIQVAPSLASAYANLGALYFKEGKVEAAYRTFVAGVKNAPADRTLLSNAAATAQQLGMSAEALSYADRAVEMNRRDPALFAVRATILRSLGRNEEALAALQQAVALDPNDAKVQFSLGNALFQLGRKEEAINAFGHATTLDRGMLRAWYNLGAALFETGHYDDALSAYKMALAPIDQAFAKGENVDPINGRAYANLGAIYLKQQQWPQAVEAYEKALRLQPNDTAVHYNLGFIYFTTGKNERAEAEYRRALAGDATLPLAYLHLGEIAMHRGDFDSALRQFRSGMATFDNEQKTLALRLTGRIDRKQSHLTEAAAALDEAAKLAPDNLDVVRERALVARDAGDLALERSLLERLLAKRDDAALRTELAIVALRQNDLDAARKLADALPANIRAALAGQSAVDRNDKSPLAQADTALLLWREGKTFEARPLIASAHVAFPTWTAVTLAAGEIALADRRLDDAVALLTSKCDTSFTPAVRDNALMIATGNDADLCARMQQSAATALLLLSAEELDRAVRRQDETAARRARQLADRAATLDTRNAAVVQFIRGTSELVGGSDAAAREALNRAVALELPPSVAAAARKNLEAATQQEPVVEVKPEPTSATPRHTVVVFLPDAAADEKHVAESMTSLFASVAAASGVPLQTEFFRRADDARNFINANREKVGIVVSNAEMLPGDLTPHFQLTNGGKQSYRRVVVVPAKSAIKSLDDLRGHTVSSVDALRDLGSGTTVRVTDDFTAVANALYGRSDAAYVSEANALLAQRARDLRVIHTSGPQPMPMIAFAPMPLADRTALDNALANTGSLARIERETTRRPEAKKIEIATVPPSALGLRMPGEPPSVALRVRVELPRTTIPEE